MAPPPSCSIRVKGQLGTEIATDPTSDITRFMGLADAGPLQRNRQKGRQEKLGSQEGKVWRMLHSRNASIVMSSIGCVDSAGRVIRKKPERCKLKKKVHVEATLPCRSTKRQRTPGFSLDPSRPPKDRVLYGWVAQAPFTRSRIPPRKPPRTPPGRPLGPPRAPPPPNCRRSRKQHRRAPPGTPPGPPPATSGHPHRSEGGRQ